MRHVKAVIFDWAGTVVDHGSLAPMGAFVETFATFGIDITIDEARGPMGMAKRPHIAALFALPRVAQAWLKRYGRAPNEGDIDAVYEIFVPRNTSVAAAIRRRLIDGAAEVGDGAARRRRQDRLDHRLYARHHGRDHAGRGRARALRPTAWSAPAIRRTGARRRSCSIAACSISRSGRPGPPSRSTTPKSASPKA